jgi:cell wall-associated NlpC family hydrolase
MVETGSYNTNSNTSSVTDEDSAMSTFYNGIIAILQKVGVEDVRKNKTTYKKSLTKYDTRITTSEATKLVNNFVSYNGALTVGLVSEITGVTSDNVSNAANNKRSYAEVGAYLETNFPNPSVDQLTDMRNGLLQSFGNIGSALAKQLANEYITSGKLTEAKYKEIVANYKDQEASVVSENLQLFTQKLANWYCENPNFFSGTYTVIGDPKYRVGQILEVEDVQSAQEVLWEYYIEGVQHNFSYAEGYTTTLTVTRGLKQSSDRFTNLYNTSEDYKGGYIGESSLADLLAEQKAKDSTSSSSSSSSSSSDGTDGGVSTGSTGGTKGSAVAEKALSIAQAHLDSSSTPSDYVYGGGRSGNIFSSSPIVADCSSFVWWCYHLAGADLAGGSTGMSTYTFNADSQLKHIFDGNKSESMLDSMKRGDLVFFNDLGHVGIYAGDKKFVACNSQSAHNPSGGIEQSEITDQYYWWGAFSGIVLRYG